MGVFDNMMLKFDENVVGVFGQWDVYSTCITVAMVTFLLFQVFTRSDPDIHPMMHERQSRPTPVRNPGESSIFRSLSVRHEMELNSGLNIRDPGVPIWSRGRDGDLRDVWRRIVNGHVDSTGKTVSKSRIMTVLGSGQVIQHDLVRISQHMNKMGEYLKKQGASRVAIYLPNSIEFLEILFACVWYDITPILLPYDHPPSTIVSMLKASKADCFIAIAGSILYEAVKKGAPNLRRIILTFDEDSKHIDRDEVSRFTGGAPNVLAWQEIVEDENLVADETPGKGTPQNLVMFWQSSKEEAGQLVEFTQSNIVSAISAQMSSIPASHCIGPSDLLLPVDSLSTAYPLIFTLAGLYNNASLALNSAAGSSADLQKATQSVSPTVIVASALTMSNTREQIVRKMTSPLTKLVHWLQTRSLIQNGVMPSTLKSFNGSLRPVIGITPRKLRLVFVSERIGDHTPLSSRALSDLRIFTGARVIYALTAAKVAGAISQTAIFDYRVDDEKQSHFGGPLSSLEILLKDTEHHKTSDVVSVGEIVARGPAVVDGEAHLGAIGTVRDDFTMAYLT